MLVGNPHHKNTCDMKPWYNNSQQEQWNHLCISYCGKQQCDKYLIHTEKLKLKKKKQTYVHWKNKEHTAWSKSSICT